MHDKEGTCTRHANHKEGSTHLFCKRSARDVAVLSEEGVRELLLGIGLAVGPRGDSFALLDVEGRNSASRAAFSAIGSSRGGTPPRIRRRMEMCGFSWMLNSSSLRSACMYLPSCRSQYDSRVIPVVRNNVPSDLGVTEKVRNRPRIAQHRPTQELMPKAHRLLSPLPYTAVQRCHRGPPRGTTFDQVHGKLLEQTSS